MDARASKQTNNKQQQWEVAQELYVRNVDQSIPINPIQSTLSFINNSTRSKHSRI